MRLTSLATFAAVLLVGAPSAFAEEKVTISPKNIGPGDPVLVRVTGGDKPPQGTALGKELRFYEVKGGHEALFAVPLDQAPGKLHFSIAGNEDLTVEVKERKFSEAELVVEEELANPPPAERDRIETDNKAIIEAARKGEGDPQFTRAFNRPKGKVTSTFGQWRTFNDGHRSQHLGVDFAARKGSPVRAVNDGTVVLVRDCFLAGKVVVLAHGGGIASAYFHLDDTTVAEGDTVERGKLVGRAGASGRATGAHLHLAVWVPGGFVDPDAFFDLKLRMGRKAASAKDK